MDNDEQRQGRRLAMARQLVDALEANDEDEARELLSDLSSERDSDLFREVGKLTRELHDALNTFQVDDTLHTLAANEIPNARQRLNHVIDMTAESAHRTLSAVEDSLPLSQGLWEQGESLRRAWQSFMERQMSAQEFRQLVRDIDAFFDQVGADAVRIHKNLGDVMLAQEAQDLSGQVIRQVIELVQKVEDSLVEMIRITGRAGQARAEEPAPPDISKGVGPVVPGVDTGDVVHSQDEVDELLSSLGF